MINYFKIKEGSNGHFIEIESCKTPRNPYSDNFEIISITVIKNINKKKERLTIYLDKDDVTLIAKTLSGILEATDN